MEEIRKFLKNETERLKRINFDKVYYLDSKKYPGVCITTHDLKEMDNDCGFLMDYIHKLDIGASILTKIEFDEENGISWGFIEIDL